MIYLESLSLVNFKNYEEADFRFSSRINCLVGKNGVGKTNVLDAICYLSQTKSYFSVFEQQSIFHGRDYFLIKGSFERKGKPERISCAYQKGRKKVVKRNDKEYERLSDHIGLVPVVMVSPADSLLLSGGSEERRRFMDMVISQYDRVYLDHLIRYNKALQQRNNQLKQFGRGGGYDRELLQIWEQQMIPAARYIYPKRNDFIREILPLFSDYYKRISLDKEQVQLHYQSALHEEEAETLFQKSLEKDRALQYTSQGIHRDDMLIEMDGYPMKKIGSQGQQKSFLVALKLAKMSFVTRHSGTAPILLLDDVFDKFDGDRVAQILALVSENHFGQIVITDTSTERLRSILENNGADYKLFLVGDGQEITTEKLDEKA